MPSNSPMQAGVVWVSMDRSEGGNPTMPVKAHETDAGYDLFVSREQVLFAKSFANVHTDIKVAIPDGFYGHIVNRSSTPKNLNCSVVSAVIDAGYRGSLFIQVRNNNDHAVVLRSGMRIAQMLILPVPSCVWREVDSLPSTPRGEGGFGSTGK